MEDDFVVGTVPFELFEAPSEPGGDLFPGFTPERRFRRSLKKGIALSAFGGLLISIHWQERLLQRTAGP